MKNCEMYVLFSLLPMIHLAGGGWFTQLEMGVQRSQSYIMKMEQERNAKAGLAYMKWYEIKQLAQEEGELLAIIKLVKKMLQQGWDVVEIAVLVERPVEWIKKVEKVVRAHPDWNEEEISHALTERPLTESLK